MSTNNTPIIADIQNLPDIRNLAINQVGIKQFKHPLLIALKNEEKQHTVANIQMTVGLPAHLKGTHMSRFIALISEQQEPISSLAMPNLLTKMLTALEAKSGAITLHFPIFLQKKAPISGVKSIMDYEIKLKCSLENDIQINIIQVIVPVTSLCPCSKQISDYGAHNQRSHVTVSVKVKSGEIVWAEDLITKVESQASAELYGLLKRADEKYVTEKAYDNPKFVEDMVRDVAALLMKSSAYEGFCVESENFESIHNHSAYAQINHKWL